METFDCDLAIGQWTMGFIWLVSQLSIIATFEMEEHESDLHFRMLSEVADLSW